MDRLEAMAILVASAEEGSLSAAGRKLGMPLPTVSRKVAELEALLKTQLLVRSTRRLALTEAGTAYVDACRRILEQVEEAEAQAAGEYSLPRGELALTAPIVFGRLHVLPVITQFLADFAEITVRLLLVDRNIDLIDDHIDIAVRIGTLPDSSMRATRIGSIRRVVCGSPAYLARHGVPTSPKDLLDHRCIAFSTMALGESWTFGTDPGGSAKPFHPPCRLYVNTAEAAIDAAVAGVGLTNVLSYQIARAVGDGALKIVLEDHEPAPVPVHLLYADKAILPLKMRRFLEFSAPRLRRSLEASQATLAGARPG